MAILKKAQVETFGLLIIVILIVFIAIFAIRLSLLSPGEDVTVKDSIIANNLVVSITKVTICQRQQFPSILRSCNNEGKSCNQDSCQLLEKELSYMLEVSGFSEEEYKLTASTNEKTLIDLGNCNIQESDAIASSPYTIYLDGNSAILKFYICNQS